MRIMKRSKGEERQEGQPKFTQLRVFLLFLSLFVGTANDSNISKTGQTRQQKKKKKKVVEFILLQLLALCCLQAQAKSD